MCKKLCLLITALLFVIPQILSAQQSEVDAVVSELYESISFNENKEPNYEKFQSLFIDGARLISVRDTTSATLTPADYESIMNKRRSSGAMIAFEEKELHRETDKYGNILHVFSTYQIRTKTPEGEESARGINSIQLMKKDGQWKVTSLIWYEEDQAHPIPSQYLPEKN